jgi:hypothetical protein
MGAKKPLKFEYLKRIKMKLPLDGLHPFLLAFFAILISALISYKIILAIVMLSKESFE